MSSTKRPSPRSSGWSSTRGTLRPKDLVSTRACSVMPLSAAAMLARPRVRLLERPPRHADREMASVGGRRMHVFERVDLGTDRAGVAKEFRPGRLAEHRLFDLRGPHGCGGDTTERERHTPYHAPRVFLEQRCRRDDGEVAMPACEFEEGIAVRIRPQRKSDRRQALVRAHARGHIAGGKFGKRNPPLAARPQDRDGRVERRRHGNDFGRGIEMAERTADGAAVARLAMPHLTNGFGKQRTAARHLIGKFDVALPRHGADLEHLSVEADERKTGYAIEIDEVIGNGVAHVQHGHQRLPSGQQPRIVQRRKQLYGLWKTLRRVVVEPRWLHGRTDYVVWMAGREIKKPRLVGPFSF